MSSTPGESLTPPPGRRRRSPPGCGRSVRRSGGRRPTGSTTRRVSAPSAARASPIRSAGNPLPVPTPRARLRRHMLSSPPRMTTVWPCESTQCTDASALSVEVTTETSETWGPRLVAPGGQTGGGSGRRGGEGPAARHVAHGPPVVARGAAGRRRGSSGTAGDLGDDPSSSSRRMRSGPGRRPPLCPSPRTDGARGGVAPGSRPGPIVSCGEAAGQRVAPVRRRASVRPSPPRGTDGSFVARERRSRPALRPPGPAVTGRRRFGRAVRRPYGDRHARADTSLIPHHRGTRGASSLRASSLVWRSPSGRGLRAGDGCRSVVAPPLAGQVGRQLLKQAPCAGGGGGRATAPGLARAVPHRDRAWHDPLGRRCCGCAP